MSVPLLNDKRPTRVVASPRRPVPVSLSLANIDRQVKRLETLAFTDPRWSYCGRPDTRFLRRERRPDRSRRAESGYEGTLHPRLMPWVGRRRITFRFGVLGLDLIAVWAQSLSNAGYVLLRTSSSAVARPAAIAIASPEADDGKPLVCRMWRGMRASPTWASIGSPRTRRPWRGRHRGHADAGWHQGHREFVR